MRRNRDFMRRRDPRFTPANPLEAARQEAWVENIDDPTLGKLVDPDRMDEAAGLLRAYIRSAIWRRRLKLIIPLSSVAFLAVGVLFVMLRFPFPVVAGAFGAATALFLSQPKTIPIWSDVIEPRHRAEPVEELDGGMPARRGRIRYSTIFRSAEVLDPYYVATHDPAALWAAAEKVDHRTSMLRRLHKLEHYEQLTPSRRQELEQLRLAAEELTDEIVRMLDPMGTAEPVALRPDGGEGALS